jgi:putative membrane protein
MLLVLCVDLDDDLGRKAGVETPVVGRAAVERAAVALATADPEDSDANVLFEGLHLHDAIDDETVAVAAVAGREGGDVAANRRVGAEVDEVLAGLSTGEGVRVIVVTDGAQDESVIPVVRSRVPIDGVRRVVVRQAQDLESIYYTMKQVLDDPETRGTVLVPLGILLLIYPLVTVADALDLPGAAVVGSVSAFLGLYVLSRGLGLERALDDLAGRVRTGLYAGRAMLITSVVASALVVVGVVGGLETLDAVAAQREASPNAIETLAALAFGSAEWLAAAGVTSSLGRITDTYLSGRFRWRYLNAPVYVLAIALALHAVSAFLLDRASLSYMAGVLTAGTILGLTSTLAFAVVEARRSRGLDPT